MTQAEQADWLGAAWADGALQVWAMQGEQVLATERQDGDVQSAERFDEALRRLTATWSLPDGLPVFAAGLPVDWTECAPRPVPCAAIASEVQPQRTAQFDLKLIPGLRQAEPAGLTQGAETQIAGFLSLNKDWDGVICLPGAATVWAQVSAGEVVSFQGFLTGEMRALLGRNSPAPTDTALDDTAFDEALSDVLSRPERLAQRLASLRAERALGDLPAPTAQARLAGMLIGAELAAARAYWLGQSLAVIGSSGDAQLYLRALSQQGAPATEADAARMMLAGLIAVRRASSTA